MRGLPSTSTLRVLGFALADALGLILAWLLLQYLLGTYTALARHQLNLGRQWRNCLVAAASVFALAALITDLRGEHWLSTMSRSFLIPVLGLGFFSTQILRVTQANLHLWQPKEQWLILVSGRERQELSQAIEDGGCELPCGLEGRAVQGMPAIPTHLLGLLDLAGVVICAEHQLKDEDRRTLLVMQKLQARFHGAELRQWMRPGMNGRGRIAGPPPEEPDAVAWELGRDLRYMRNHYLLFALRLLPTSVLTLIVPARWS